jgi:transcriptional regulator with XRE-family HTH domain
VGQTKRTGERRNSGLKGGKRSNFPSPIDSGGGPTTRRFSPSQSSVTAGGEVYGTLIAKERAKLGLTQTELAERIYASPSEVARIEGGHPPRAELRKRLAVALNANPTSALGRATGPHGLALSPEVNRAAPRQRSAREPAPREPAPRERVRLARDSLASRWTLPSRWILERVPRERVRLPRVSPSPRSIRGSLAMAGLAILAVVVAGWIGDSGGASSRSPSPARASDAIGVQAAIDTARSQAQRAAAIIARRKTAARRERELAAAAAKKGAAKSDRHRTLAESQPGSKPLTPLPTPSEGGSNAQKPNLQHGLVSRGDPPPSSAGSTSNGNGPQSSPPTCGIPLLC